MKRLARAAFSAVLAFLALTPGGRADVLILEAPELGSFFDPQAAVALAPEGATLVFGIEPMPGFIVDGKSLTLVGPASNAVSIEGTLVIRNLGPGQAVRVQGLRLQGESTTTLAQDSQVALEVADCQGAVRLSGCRIQGGHGIYDLDQEQYPGGAIGLLVRNADDIALTGCEVSGGVGAGFSSSFCCTGGNGATALDVEDSELALYDCLLVGGTGGDAGLFGGDGGDGVQASQTRLFASGCFFEGGAGGDSVDLFVTPGGDGGDGLRAMGLPRPRLLDSSFVGGAAGLGVGGLGEHGADRSWDMGSLPLLPGAHRGLQIADPLVLTGATFPVDLEGQAGDRFFVAASLQDARAQTFTPPGVRLVPKPTLLPTTPQATLFFDGSFQVNLPPLGVPAGANSATWMIQAFVKDTNGMTHIAGAGLVTMMRASAEPDCNGSGKWDVFEAMTPFAVDCDGNLELDACQTQPDCNRNGIADGIETDCNSTPDLNGNSIPDTCEESSEIFVDPELGLGGDGSFNNPFGSLAAAFDAALDGDTLRLFDGTFRGPNNRDLNADGRSLTLESLGGSQSCVIDLEGEGRLLFGLGGPEGGLVRLSGLRILNGNSGLGGAVWLSELDGVFEDCVFRNNYGSSGGGALFLSEGDFELKGCQFQDNATDTGGQVARVGGAVSAQGKVTVESCVFDRNRSDLGGALRLEITAATVDQPFLISHSIFRTNEAIRRGGAIHTPNGGGDAQGIMLQADHCFFAFNSALIAGGAYFHIGNSTPAADSTSRFTSCTMVSNTAGTGTAALSGGGAIYLGSGAGTEIIGSVLWGNAAGVGEQVRGAGSAALPAAIRVQASTVEGGEAGFALLNGSTALFSGDSLTSDPLFVNPPLDFRLGAGSPCIDSMSPALLNFDLGDVDGDGDTGERVPLDLVGAPRRVDDPSAPDVGAGPAPLPDMGAFERQP